VTYAEDNDCPAECGNGVMEPGEECDGDCATVCDKGDPCMTYGHNNCACTEADKGRTDNDGCCHSGDEEYQDNDCAAVCGNSEEETGEACDDGKNGDECDGCLDDCT